MFDGETAAALECSVSVPAATFAFPSASLPAPAASCVEPEASLVLPSARSEAPAARTSEPLSSPGLAGSAGSPWMPVFRATAPGGKPAEPSVIPALGPEQARAIGVSGHAVHPHPEFGSAIGQELRAEDNPGARRVLAVELAAQGGEAGGQLAGTRLQFPGAFVEPRGAGLKLSCSGVELVGASGDLCNFVLHQGQRHKPPDGVFGGGLQQVKGLGQGSGASTRFRIAVGPAVALELVCPGSELACTCVQSASSGGELCGAVGQIVLCGSGGRRSQGCGELRRSGGQLAGTVVNFVHAGGELVADVRFDPGRSRCQPFGTSLQLVRAGSEFLADAGMDLLGPC